MVKGWPFSSSTGSIRAIILVKLTAYAIFDFYMKADVLSNKQVVCLRECETNSNQIWCNRDQEGI